MISYLVASLKAAGAFLKAYDREVGLTLEGMPKLHGWKDNDSPYSFSSPRLAKNPRNPVAALVFYQGLEKGEVVYLPKGHFTLGQGCTNSIVVTSSAEPSERVLHLNVESDGVTARTLDSSFLVNANALSEAVLVDQDECEFESAQFSYFNLSNTEESSYGN